MMGLLLLFQFVSGSHFGLDCLRFERRSLINGLLLGRNNIISVLCGQFDAVSVSVCPSPVLGSCLARLTVIAPGFMHRSGPLPTNTDRASTICPGLRLEFSISDMDCLTQLLLSSIPGSIYRAVWF
jgi:hypothetical protein